MKIQSNVWWIATVIVLVGAAAFANPLPVQPLPAAAAQDLLWQVESGTLLANRSNTVMDMQPVNLAGSPDNVPGYLEQLAGTFQRDGRELAIPTYFGNGTPAGHISMSNRHRSSLDLPSCSLEVAPDTALSYYAGIIPGDAYKVWIDPSGCGGCNPVYPFAIDSVKLNIVQDGGSPVDTVLIGLDIECARFNPDDPCQGPGQERCFSLWRVTLPADTDQIGQIWTVTLDMDSCWIDGPSFLGLWHFGHTVTDTSIFHPSIAFAADTIPPVVPCHAWANLSGTWEQWADVWVGTPGYPSVTVYGECNSTPPEPIAACPEACTQRRGDGSLAFYDPTATAVWQWFGLFPPDLAFPYKPMSIDFSLYYVAAGSADDSVQVLITYGCRRLNDICCAPMDPLCGGSIWLVRGSTGAGILPVSLDLSAMSCCLQEEFWVGAAIVAVGTGDPIPSFLWSSTATDPFPVPDCEQWVFSGGSYLHWPNGTEGWADLVLSGSCEDCLGDTANICPAFTPESPDCGGATDVSCGSVTLTGQTNGSGLNNVNTYCCAPWDEAGPEKIYRITVPAGNNLSATLSNIVGGDVDVFLLSSCNAAACVAGGDVSFNGEALAGGTYYVIVDGFAGDVATFDITFSCFASCHADQCVAEFHAGTAVTTSRYLDGEWDNAMGDTVYYQYYPGSGSVQSILKFNPATCDTFRRITWTSADASTNRVLAVDPRHGGQFWTHTATNFTTGTGRLYRVNMAGTVLNTWTAIPGLPHLRFSGAAFDPNHNHLWVFVRDSANLGLDRAYELDVNNDSATPVVIQGPHPVPNISPYVRGSTGGADYAQFVDKILLMSQGTPNDFVECLTDVDPAYAGPPPGPGLTAYSWCPPDSNTLQGFGLAALDRMNGGTLFVTNFTDGNPPHPINHYPAPCQLIHCDRVVDSRIIMAGGSLTIYWTAPQAGDYRIYVTTNKNNDGNPDGGTDPNFAVWVTVNVPTAGAASWTAPNITDPYRNYVITAICN